MAQNPKSPKEEEYKLPEQELMPEPPEEQPPHKKGLIGKLLANKRLWVIVAVVVAIFVVYTFLSRTPGTKEEAPAVTSSTPVTLKSEPEAMSTTMTPSMAEQPKPLVVETPVETENQQQLGSLAQQTQQNQQQIQQIQNSVQQIQSSVAQLGTQVTAACPVSKPSPVVSPQVVVPPVKKIIVQPRRIVPMPEYSIRAAVPGRAWLQEKKQNRIVRLTTVKVGDVVPGYGRVQKIDPRGGRVWTSGGRVIRYGTLDS